MWRKADKLGWQVTSLGLAWLLVGSSASGKDFAKIVAPIVSKYCMGCHGAEKQSGSMTLHQFKTTEDVRKDRSAWEAVLERVRLREMPPKSSPQPSEAERKQLVEWLEAELSTSVCSGPPQVGRVTLRRLNRVEYANTIRDLFGMEDLAAGDGFPSDDVGYGFDNIGDVLSLSPLHLEKYLSSADRVLDRVFSRESRVKPILRIFAANERDWVATGRTKLMPDDQGRIVLEGALARPFNIEHPGEYTVTVRALGESYDDVAPRLALRVDDRVVDQFDVLPGRSDPKSKRQAKNHVARVQLQPGTRKFGLNLLNPGRDSKAGGIERSVTLVHLALAGPTSVPLPEPSAGYRLTVLAQPSADLPPDKAAERSLAQFARRAFRRPATPAEVEKLVSLFRMASRQGESFDESLKLAMKAVLVSPHFLFKVEQNARDARSGEASLVSEFELATRLSYFLWSAMPDDALFESAQRGELRRPDVLRGHVRRMLADPKSRALADNFAGQWLETRSVRSLAFDRQRFPHFDESLRSAMIEETLRFFDHVVRTDSTVMDLINAEYTFVNERLARHYGIPGVRGPEFRQVSLRGKHRAGVLTHASVLAVTSNPTRTSPVKRGKFLLENFLGVNIPPPPPDVPELDESAEVHGSLREQLAQHRANPACASCHDRMDPPGLAFENFDAIGGYRDRDGSRPIDASGELSDGTRFKNLGEFRAILDKRRDEFRNTLASRLLTFGLGRGLDHADRCTVDELAKKTREQGDRFSALVVAIVECDPFQKRASQVQKP